MRLCNTLTRTTETFESLDPGVVRMYNCGPTVYSHPHIGNFRAFLFADLLRRWLEHRGYRVRQVLNITDVGHLTEDDLERGEDKMLAASRREGVDPWAIAHKYTEEFFACCKLLGCREAEVYPRATDHIPEMIDHIERLLGKDLAYIANGAVYFSVEKFPRYGRLSGNSLEDLVAGARVEVHLDKRHPADFALWKRDEKHLMQWDSPWGRGFPGWHIECSAMAAKYLGETLDIHTGGEDNIFPHHESEIAQTEGVTGKPFARFWLHARHLLVDGKKMSKSLGNFLTMQDMFDAGHGPRELRYALQAVHYRQPLNFTADSVSGARSALGRADSLARRLGDLPQDGPAPAWTESVARAWQAFEAAMDDDLNVSAALGAFFGWVKDANREMPPVDPDGAGGRLISRVLSVLGLAEPATVPEVLPEEIDRLIQARQAARAARDFARADAIREELRARGILIEDTPEGVRRHKA